MEPDERREWWPGWNMDAYWAKKEAREKLLLARQRAQKNRQSRKRRFKLAQSSRRRNRRAE